MSYSMKFTYVLNWILFSLGLYLDEYIIAVGSVLIFVILSVAIEILDAIHALKG